MIQFRLKETQGPLPLALLLTGADEGAIANPWGGSTRDIYIYIYMYITVYDMQMYVYIHTQTYFYIYIYIYIYIYMYIDVFVEQNSGTWGATEKVRQCGVEDTPCRES